uniref:Palmitoyltransferase n=1 Tax=Catagonus wagneri TaxID=51154 RepID=A0A8C3YIF6_9CETA
PHPPALLPGCPCPRPACPHVLQMALCARGLRRVLPEAGTLRARAVVPPRLSRVNGWSRPLHSFQLITWAVFLILAVTSFGVFIPLMPHIWRQAAYGVSFHGVVGGIFLFHFIVHVITISINPAEASVHQKNYSEPVPVFDRSKHAHVIQDQYCHLCEATVDAKAKHCSACNKCVSGFDHHCKWLNNCVGTKNYWYFFSSMASSLAGLICILVILLYLFVQFLVEPSQLRTDPHFAGVSSESTWLLFLPALPVRAEAPAILSVGAAVLLLVLIGLVLLGQLFFFHLFLSTSTRQGPHSTRATPPRGRGRATSRRERRKRCGWWERGSRRPPGGDVASAAGGH